ncbi:MAG: FtsQ-type POTRA domain-containing protein [Candidatus Moranbacteria bacterium]|nr:FtsQ-type POTRA domain-containing protein [Candidatus Moranbacteria bacterium]
MGQTPDIQKIVRKSHSPNFFSQKKERRFVRGGADALAHRKQDRLSFVRIWQITFLWVLFFGVSGYQIFFSGILSVKHVEIDGTGMMTTDEVKRTVQVILSENTWGFLPQSNFLLLSTQRTGERILAASPLVRQVTVRKLFPDTLDVSLLERGAFLFWCSEPERCFLIDEEGMLQDWPEAREERRVSHLFLRDKSGKSVSDGERIMTPEILLFMKGLPQAFLEQADIVIGENILVPSKYANELHLETDKGFSLQISTDIPIETTLNILRIVREKAVPEDRQSDLVSVDLRIIGKAFYQLRDETPQEAMVDSGESEY